MNSLSLYCFYFSILLYRYYATNHLTYYYLLRNIGSVGSRFCDPSHCRDPFKSFTLLCFDAS